MNIEYKEFPKIHRFSREVIVTEKLDGTNGLIEIENKANVSNEKFMLAIGDSGDLIMFAGSRTRYIMVGDDNYGFAKWATDNQEELFKLGEGRHHGEWWGQGIQRKYGLAEKRFSLFNTFRWSDDAIRPSCCHVVPVLWEGNFDEFNVAPVMASLGLSGSMAAPGFMKPEGIVIFHTQGNTMFKKTFEKDDHGKNYGS
jgi:hypothetical protein